MKGFLECIHRGAIHGWALCTSDPDRLPEVEIITDDGEVVASGKPSISRPDLDDKIAGFRIPIPSSIFMRPDCCLSARFKHTSLALNGDSLRVGIQDRYQIYCDGFAEKDILTGWAIDLADPALILKANLVLGSDILDSAKCEGAIDNSNKIGRFHLKLPDRLFQGKVYEFSIQLEGVSGVQRYIKCFLPKDGAADLNTFPFLSWEECENFPKAVRQKKIWKGYFEKSRQLRESRQELLSSTPYSNPGSGILSCAMKDELKNGNKALAVELARLNATLNSDAPETHSEYALALFDTGKTEEAGEYIRSLAPGMRRTDQILAIQRKIESLGKSKSVRTIAFYLPQFHPVEENNRYWGKGFTEWDNVTRAIPYLQGQVQPRRPIGLGYYDLRLPEVANAQFRLARESGIDGFCYYYYWFNGKKILDTPLNQHLNGKTEPFPFCICWANENWTRQWDGGDSEILLFQEHTVESDREFIKDIAPCLAHADYIRYEDKPVLLVYRVNKIKNPAATAQAWREYCRNTGIGEIFLCAVHSFSFEDPRTIGFDAAVDFPPMSNWRKYGSSYFYTSPASVPPMLPNVKAADLEVVDYEHFRKAFIHRPSAPYIHFRSSMLAWDNTPRRKEKGAIHLGFSPASHQAWLWSNMEKGMSDNGETLVFINAWNEWSEGCSLEPDSHWGYANLGYIEKLKPVAALAPYGTYWRAGLPDTDGGRPYKHETIAIAAGEDADFTFLLEFARALHLQCENEVIFVFDKGVQFREAFERLGDVFLTLENKQNAKEKYLDEIAKRIEARGVNKILSFGVRASWMLNTFYGAGFRIVQVFPDKVAAKSLEPDYRRNMNNFCRALVFFSRSRALDYARLALPFLDKLYLARHGGAKEKAALPENGAKSLNQPSRLVIYGKNGTGSNVDLFLAVAQAALPIIPDLAIILYAHQAIAMDTLDKVKAAHLEAVVSLKTNAKIEKPRDGAPAIFLETGTGPQSRLNLLEAMSNGIPIAFFETDELPDLESSFGCSANYPDVGDMASNLAEFGSNPERFNEASQRVLSYMDGPGSLGSFAASILNFFGESGAENNRFRVFSPSPAPGFKKISVIIPNFNYARYLELRLESVFLQTLRPAEIIILDDGSSDGSLDIIERMMPETKIPCKFVSTEGEPAGTFAQWAKGIEMASGEIIWIAEADDYCEPSFLAEVSAKFDYPDVCLAWSDSMQIDKDGKRIQEYKDVYRDMYEGAVYDHDLLLEGSTLLKKALYYFNALPNASAVLFKKSAIKEDLEEIKRFKACGDWWLWSSLCAKGKAAYVSRPLNYHRVHHSSVVSTLKKDKLIEAIIENIEIFNSFGKRPELNPDGRSVLEIFRRVEMMYNGNRQFLETDVVWCKNHPAFRHAYELLEAQYNPRQFLNGREPAQLALSLTDADCNFIDLINYLNRQHALSVLILGERIRMHPAYETFRNANVPVRFIDTLERARPNGLMQFYGLSAILEASRTAIDYPYEVILDASFSRLPDALPAISADMDLDALVNFIQNASGVFFIGEKIPEEARPLLAGAMTIASRLKVENSSDLKNHFTLGADFEEDVFFYDIPLGKALLRNARAEM